MAKVFPCRDDAPTVNWLSTSEVRYDVSSCHFAPPRQALANVKSQDSDLQSDPGIAVQSAGLSQVRAFSYFHGKHCWGSRTVNCFQAITMLSLRLL